MSQNRQTNNEVLELLRHIPLKNYLKIPDKEITYLKTHQDENYYFKYNEEASIESQNISREALIIFTRLYITYIANQKEQEIIKSMLKLNDLKNEAKKQKYDSSEVFKNKKTISVTNTLPIKTQNDGIFQKLFSIIKNFYYKILKK